MVESNAARAGEVDQREQIPDNVLMYACIFTYEKAKVRTQLLNYEVNYSVIENLESKCVDSISIYSHIFGNKVVSK